MVSHEPGDAMLRRIPGREDIDMINLRIIGHNELLTPVAQHVAIPAGVRLRRVIERTLAFIAIYREGVSTNRVLVTYLQLFGIIVQ